MLILYTGGNTSFNGFPYLASFVAGDSFLPRQLTKRGHRLAFSNGIFVLAVVAILLIIAFKAQLNALVGLYAVGVFTGFTFAGFGMVKHNLRVREQRWKLGVVVNAFSGTLSLTVVAILLVTKFTEGAWIVAVVGPPMYFGLIRLHRQYVAEEKQLETGAAAAAEAPVLQRHVVLVLIGQLDMAAARAVQYARTLRPDELRAVHFNIDVVATEQLKEEWSRLGLAHLPLDIVECRDRRVERAAIEYVADIAADGKTECTVLLPRRAFHSRLARVLHDRTADRIADAVGTVAHVAATIVPFNVETAQRRRFRPHAIRPDADRGASRCAAPVSTASSRAARRAPSRSATSRGAPVCVLPAASARCACKRRRARPTSSARSPMTPASCCWSSRGGRRSPVSSRVRDSSSRGWPARGHTGWRSSTPITNWSASSVRCYHPVRNLRSTSGR